MTYFNGGGDRSRSTNYGKRDSMSRGFDKPELHEAICAKCGSACQVPFVPNGRKEVFCSRCFSEMNGGERDTRNAQRFERRDNRPKMYDNRDGGSNFSDRQMFRATCDQCGQSCEVPFRPTNGKPVLCSNCFADSKNDGRSFASNANTIQKTFKDNSVDLNVINGKLDKIIKLLTPVDYNAESKSVAKEITAKILEDIETNIEKTQAVSKRKVKKAPKAE